MNEQGSKDNPTIKESMGQAKDEIKSTVREAKDTIKSKTMEAVSEAKGYGQEYAQQGREQTADRIGDVSQAVRETAGRFEREQDPNIARYTRMLADRLEGAASYVRDHDFNRIRSDCEDLARRHPAVFFGGMFIAGFAAARFLKASAGREGNWEGSNGGEGFSSGGGSPESHQTVTQREQEQCQPCATM
jgi:vacuolar-type H+-ATPase subunit H